MTLQCEKRSPDYLKGVLVNRVTDTIRAEAGCTQADLSHVRVHQAI